MLSEVIQSKLMGVDSSRKKRVVIASWIVQKPHYVREILHWCFTEESDLLVKTSWTLEKICEQRPRHFLKYKYLFFERLPSIQDHSALRSCAKICEMLCNYHFRYKFGITYSVLSDEQKAVITECCFDWLITDQKVACQAPAMECLYYLGRDGDKKWIYSDLKNILTENALQKSAGYQARARKILKRIG